MLVTPSTLNSDPVGTLAGRGRVAVLLRRVFAVILYPVKFIVELWIENDDMSSILNDSLQAGASAPEVFLCRRVQLHSIHLLRGSVISRGLGIAR